MVLVPVTMMKNWKRKVSYLWGMWIVTIICVEVNFTNEFHIEKILIITAFLILMSMYYKTHCEHLKGYLEMLQDKHLEEESWKTLLD